MTLAWRLLRGYVGDAQDTTPFVLTTAPSGGWTQIPEPRAIYYNGVTYFGYINGSNGNVEIRTYTHSSGVVSSPTVLHAALGADTHEAPAILVRSSDQRIVCAYSAHNGAALYVWISTNPEDISAGSETNIDVAVGSGVYTYANLVQLSGESGKIYLFFRNVTAFVTAFWQFTTSTDGGATWATYTELYSVPSTLTYWKIASDGVNRIDFVVSSANPSAPTSKIGHFYYDGTWHKSDGTGITLPLAFTNVTEVYGSGTGPGWATDLYLDGSNHPRFVYNVDNGSLTDSYFGYARWTGSAWVLSTILASVGFGVNDPSPVASLNPSTSACHLVRYIAGHHEIWRYSSLDNGATWSGVAVTSGSIVDNLYPLNVRDHATGLATLWLTGTYTDATSNSLGIMGVGQ